MAVNKEKWNELRKRMKTLHILEEDLKERFVIGSGPGGQKVQKSHTCVHLLHIPSQTEVKCQKTRQREDNRFFARRTLCDRIETKLHGKKSPSIKAAEKRRKQKKRRKRRSSLVPDS